MTDGKTETDTLDAYVKLKDELDAIKAERDGLKKLNDDLAGTITTTNADVAKLQKIIAEHVISAAPSASAEPKTLRDVFMAEYRKNKG